MSDEKVDINELLEEWHANHFVGMALHDYLGMTIESYSRWVETGDLPHDSNLYDSTRETLGAREADRRLRSKARRRALNRLGGRHRSEYLRLLNEEIRLLRKEAREQ